MDSAEVPIRHRAFVPPAKGGQSETLRRWYDSGVGICLRLGTGFLFAILGQRGTGKTQLAVVCMRYAIKHGMVCHYCKAMEIFLHIKSTYNKPDKSELEIIQKFITPSLLVIDEIQQRGDTQFEDRILAYIIDKRYDAMRDTILIGNIRPDSLAESMDPSIVDRLKETGGIIECRWPSFRASQTEGVT